MNTQPIVVGVDGTDGAVRAARWGADEAGKRQVPLALVHAFGVPDAFAGEAAPPKEWLQAAETRSRAWLERARDAALRTRPTLDVVSESCSDTPIRVLLARSATARMVVVGSASRGRLRDLMLGSTAPSLAAHARCPVAVVRGREPGSHEPVVVGIEGASDAAVALAFEEATLRGVELIALHAARPWESTDDDVVSAAVAVWREKYPDLGVDQITVRDDPRERLLDWSERAQLVLVGSRGRGGFAGLLLGSTSHAILHHAHCPMIVVRTDVTSRASNRR